MMARPGPFPSARADSARLSRRTSEANPLDSSKGVARAICGRYTAATLAPAIWIVKQRRTRPTGSGSRVLEPSAEEVRLQHGHRALPARGVVAAKVEVDGRDLRLDGSPQCPADIRHQRKQVHPRQLARIVPAEVRSAEGSPQVLVELRLLCRVAQVKARVVIAAELVVDDAQSGAVIDEVLAQQIVVARHCRQRAGADRALDLGDGRQPG